MQKSKSKRWLGVVASAFIGCGALIGIHTTVVPIAHAEDAVHQTSLTQLFPALDGVNLTADQQTTLQALSDQTLPEIQAVLTPDQQKQFKQAIAEGMGVGVSLSSLELTSEQQGQLKALLEPVRSQLEETLTPEQQRQLRRNALALQRQRL